MFEFVIITHHSLYQEGPVAADSHKDHDNRNKGLVQISSTPQPHQGCCWYVVNLQQDKTHQHFTVL